MMFDFNLPDPKMAASSVLRQLRTTSQPCLTNAPRDYSTHLYTKSVDIRPVCVLQIQIWVLTESDVLLQQVVKFTIL